MREDEGMTNPPSSRSVKIADDERGGWSSDRPRGNRPPREADISTRCRVMSPSDRVRYSPGSLLLIVSAAADERERFAERVIEEKNALLSPAKIRGLLAGRVPAEDLDARTAELLDATVAKRLEAGASVVIPLEGLAPEAREPYVRQAAKLRRPRHLVLLETAKENVAEDDAAVLNDLRRMLDTGELGNEGIQTAMRLGGTAIGELKRIVFQPAPRDDD